MSVSRPDYQTALDLLRIHLGIPPDEPLFLLRGQDKAWITAAKQHGADQQTLDSALEVARALENWPVKKIPDTPAAES